MLCYTALGAGFSTHLGSKRSEADESESRRKCSCLEVVAGLVHGLQDKKEYLLFFWGIFLAVQIIT